MMGRILRLVLLDLLRQLGQGRWKAAFPVFIMIGFSWTPGVQFDYENQQSRIINMLDVPAAVLSNPFSLSWMYLVGFTLLIGDSFVREREEGTLLGIVVRAPSRASWWLAKILALFGLSLLFVMGSLVGMLIGACLHGAALSLSDSPTAVMLATQRFSSLLYFRPDGFPMWLFLLGLGLYTGFALWILAAFVVSTSLFWARSYVPLIVACGLTGMGIFSSQSLIGQSLFFSMIDTSYFLSSAKHFEQAIFPRLMSLPQFLAISVLILLSILGIGIWRVKRLDL